MSSKSTVTDPQTQTPTKNIILSYSSNFTPTINNTTSLRNAHRNVMAHTRNSSSPASYFNSNSTSHRRVYSAKSILRESYSGNSKSLKSKESNNIKNNDEEIHRLINSDSATIEKSNDFPESSYAAANSSDVYSQTENINRRSSISLSSSSSIRSVHPFTHIHKKRLSRTIQHISSFIQIVANITSTISVPITIEKTYTVERLARQIEAEYAFKFGGFEQGGLYEPLEVGLLYDVSMISLRFRDLVGDVLEHGDVVNVLNIYEGFNDNIEKDDSDSVINILPSETKETKTSEVKRYSMPIISPRNSTILPRSNSPTPNTSTSSLQSIIHNQKEIQDSETRFQAVLSNTLAINYFQKFAIKEYSVENLLFWLDVELFAAGNSCDIEDNYFEEQQTAVIHARYIYYTYIYSDAPLQVNISDEIRRDINWPIDDDDVVERNMFDEAQEAVYQLMKGYTFIGFEDSPEWQECARRKKLEPKEYQSYEMTKSLESYFHPNMSIMLAVTMAHDPSIKQPPVSHHYKEQTLHTILSQYFPETILLDNRGIRRMQCAANDENPNLNGYFDNENRLTNAQRMRKIKKERKLKWVFGERINRMDDQIVVMPDETLYGNGRIGYGDDDDTKSISSTISENRKVAKDVWNKKKKVEKLESIFGRGLKDSQLYSQNILNEKRDSLTGTLNSPSTTPQTQNFNSETPDSPQLQTMNELSANDRRMLWKKTKKLQIMFGEALDEDIVRQALTLPVIQSTPGHSPNSERFSSDRSTYNDHDRYSRSSNGSFMNKQINRRASDSMISPLIPSESTSNTITSSIVTPPASPPVSLDEKLSNKHTIKGVPSINPDTVPLIIVNKDTKEYRRKKLQKLYRFLGEKVPINAVLGEYDDDLEEPLTPQSAPLSPPPPPPPPPSSNFKNKKRRPNSLSFNKKDSKDNISFISNTSNTLDQNDVSVTKLSAVDRKRHLQRAVKLQKMFGETPPQNLIFSQSKFMSDNSSDCSSIDLHRRSIMSLEYLMENDRETMYELINYMENSDEGENQEDTDNIDSRRKSSPPTPYSSSPSTNFALPNQQNRPRKQKKLKGIRKLSHFFGATYGQMFPDQVLGELLGDLEREIRDEAKQNNQLDKSVVAGLMDQLEELRAKTSEFGPDSGDEGGTTEGSAITDDEYSLEGLRRALERNGKNRSFDSEKMLIRTR